VHGKQVLTCLRLLGFRSRNAQTFPACPAQFDRWVAHVLAFIHLAAAVI
jgi:hypothetical protein